MAKQYNCQDIDNFRIATVGTLFTLFALSLNSQIYFSYIGVGAAGKQQFVEDLVS